jgi:hypothetical protein
MYPEKRACVREREENAGCTVEVTVWSGLSDKSHRVYGRGTNLFLGKQYQPHISNTKKAIVRKKAISSCTAQEQGLASGLL